MIEKHSFDIEGESYVVELPEGYARSSKRIAFKSEKPGVYAVNQIGRERWFRAKMARYLKDA